MKWFRFLLVEIVGKTKVWDFAENNFNYEVSKANNYDNNFSKNLVPNTNNHPKDKKTKKRKTIYLVAICCISAIIIGSFGYLISYLVNNSNKEKDSYTQTSFQTDTSTTAVAAMQYILQRTVSLSFIINFNGAAQYAISGTGWIYQKDSSKDNTYYIATNIHVATYLSLIGTDSYYTDDNNSYSYSTATITYTKISFVKENLIKNSSGTSAYHFYPYQLSSVYLSGAPEIFYTANTQGDSNLATVFNSDSTGSLNDSTLASMQNDSLASAGIDFLILKVNFDNIYSGNTNLFKTWLNNYTDTSFYDTSDKTALQQKQYYMGGFPIIGDNNSPAWVGYSDITYSDNTSYGSQTENGLIYYFQNRSSYSEKVYSYQNGKLYSNYDVANYLAMDASSVGGASGSMIIINAGTDKSPDFEVVGIYWGYTAPESEEGDQSTTSDSDKVGMGSLLVSGSYSNYGMTISGYDVLSSVNQKISEDE